MRLDPQKENKDLCHTSIDLLAEKCRLWFEREGVKDPIWFADEKNIFPPFDSRTPLHVVLFGGFFRRILESGNWTFPRMFLWVVSWRVKEVLVQLMGFPEESVGVIPRSRLFEKNGGEKKRVLDLSQPTTFVFAGRLSPTKNMEMVLRTVFFLQTEHGLPVSLEMFGDFDHEVHPDHGRRERTDYREDLRRVIETLEWKIPPKLHPKMGTQEWLVQDCTNPVYLNFSTFVWEDFDVSLEQSRRQGWPAFVTDWGGHGDVEDPSVRHFFSGYVGHSHEPSSLIELKARHLAGLMSRTCQGEVEVPRKRASHEFFPPRETNLEEIDHLRRSLVNRLGPHSLKIQREGVEAFADSKEGRNFFANYRFLFAGKKSPRDFWLVLVNDFHPSQDPLMKDMKKVCHRILDAAFEEQKEVMFISAREINQPWNALHLAAASKVILPFYAPRFDSLVLGLKKHMREDAVFVTQNPEGPL